MLLLLLDTDMSPLTADEHLAMFPSARWEHHAFSDGPMRQVLMHVGTDLRTSSIGQEGCTVRACARIMLSDGSLLGLLLSGPLSSLWSLLHAAALLATTHHAVFDSNTLSATLAAHAGGMRIALEHDARILPSPVVTAGQVLRLQRRIGLRASRTPIALSDWMAAQFPCEHSWHHPAVEAWLSVLDPAALAYVCDDAALGRGVAPSRLAVYNFLVGCQGTYCRERIQAVSVLPWLLPILATGSDHISQEAVQICRAIDARQPLFQAVARVFDVPRETVRWLGRAALPGNWHLDARRLRGLLALLSWLPVKWRPGTTAQFEMLVALGNVVAAPLDFHDTSLPHTPAQRSRRTACMRRWLADAARPGMVAKRQGGLSALQRDAADAADFLRALLAGAIVEMPGCSDATCALWVMDWGAGVSLHRLLALSEQWHVATVQSIGEGDDDNDGSVSGAQNWPAVLPHSWRFEDRTVVELTSGSDLLAEGRALQHCVAGYSYRCVRMDSILVSVRNAEGWPCSTAELHLTEQGIVTGQHRAVSNSAPEAECERAIAALVRSLNSANCAALLQRRRTFQRAHAQRHDSEQYVARQHIAAATRRAGELAWQLALS